MATVLRSHLVTICRAIQRQLVLTIGLRPEYIKLASEFEQSPRSDRDIILRPRGFIVDRYVADPAGRILTAVRRKLTVGIRTRLQLDDAGHKDEQFLFHANLGSLPFEEEVAGVLQEWSPVDEADNALTLEPMHLLGGTDPGGEREDVWGQTFIDFELYYALPLSQNNYATPPAEP